LGHLQFLLSGSGLGLYLSSSFDRLSQFLLLRLKVLQQWCELRLSLLSGLGRLRELLLSCFDGPLKQSEIRPSLIPVPGDVTQLLLSRLKRLPEGVELGLGLLLCLGELRELLLGGSTPALEVCHRARGPLLLGQLRAQPRLTLLQPRDGSLRGFPLVSRG
jgi:hypothetical protein